MTLPIIAGAVVSLVQILGWDSITMVHLDADDNLGKYYFRQVIGRCKKSTVNFDA